MPCRERHAAAAPKAAHVKAHCSCTRAVGRAVRKRGQRFAQPAVHVVQSAAHAAERAAARGRRGAAPAGRGARPDAPASTRAAAFAQRASSVRSSRRMATSRRAAGARARSAMQAADPARRARPRPKVSGARASATKSAIVKSISWPMPLTTGIGLATMARATRSSLNAQRSSSEPPPRARINTSHSRRARCQAQRIDDAGRRRGALHRGWIDRARRRAGSGARACAGRRASPRRVGEVMTPMRRGKRGQLALALQREQAFRGELRPSAARTHVSAHRAPASSSCSTISWKSPRGS